ncbi:MAG: shikimate dehydrogenase, partial [Candidatus Omnitrophota bacterium]
RSLTFRKLWSHYMIQPPPKIYGLIGYPVKHSLSPLMHNAAFKHLGINAEYKLFPVKPEELEDFLLNNKPAAETGFSLKDISGFNITIPHKVRAKEILEAEFPYDKNTVWIKELLYYVLVSGAVNTVKKADNHELSYFNTDAKGFIKSLDNDLNFKTINKDVFVIGCGGAGRAVIAALRWRDQKVKRIYVYDSSAEAVNSAKKQFSQVQQIMDKLEFINREQIPEVIKKCQLLVNASSVGMNQGDGSVIDKKLLHKGLSVYDLVYNRKTQLIKDAESIGIPRANGLGMLLYQGVEAFGLWTEKDAPVEIMRQALEGAIKK